MKVIDDLIRAVSEDVRSMKEIFNMANSIFQILQFTVDCPGPTQMDKCCWMENKVMYEHYSKPIASKLAIKILENTSLDVPQSSRAQSSVVKRQPVDEGISMKCSVQIKHHACSRL